MIFRILLILSMLGVVAHNALAENYEHIAIGDGLYALEIQDGAFVIVHEFPWAANALLVQMADDSLVLVDMPSTPEASEALIDWANEHFGEQELVVINTGFHMDSLGGNSTFIAQDIPVYGSDLTVELLEERGEDTRQQTLGFLEGWSAYYAIHVEIPYIVPTELFTLEEAEEGITLPFDEEELLILFPGAAHSPDNLVVYFPERRLLFGGHLVLGAGQLGNVADAALGEWIESVIQLEQFDADIIIPAHGDDFDVSVIDETIRLIEQATSD